MGRRGGGEARVAVSLDSKFLCFLSTTKAFKMWDGYGYVEIPKSKGRYGNRTGIGSLPLWIRKYGKGTDCFKLLGVRIMYWSKIV